ncbi:MAG: tetratricopeptide repeat protein [Panacagrimonas sp.]
MPLPPDSELSRRRWLSPLVGVGLACLAAGSFAAESEPEPGTAPAREGEVLLEPGPQLSESQKVEFQFQIMAGEMAAGRGQPELAAQAFVRALELQPDADIASRATQFALAASNLELSQRAARRWLELEPTSMDAREVLARLALRVGDPEEAYAQSLGIIRGHAGGPAEGFRHVAVLLSGDPERGEQVLQIMDRLVSQYPDLGGARYAYSLAALRFHQLGVAERSARDALRLEPKSSDYTLLLIGVLARTGQLQESDALAEKLVKQAKGDQKGEVRMSYARLLLDAGHREAARTQIKAALKRNDKDLDARYALAVMALTDGNLDESESLLKPMADDAERADEVHFQLGRIAENREQYEQALAHYRKVGSGAQAMDATVRQASVMTRMGQVDEGRALLDRLRQQFPPLAPRITLAEGEILTDAGRYEDSLAVYNRALEQAPTDSDLLYGRSLAYEKSGQFEKSESDLRAILSRDPTDARAMNALGYMLVVNTTRYEEAQKLIEGALEREPNDAAVIDSMGWVLFKQGKLPEAREHLQKALGKVPDPEISAHLGEVLWAMGEREQAKEVWDRALARKPDHRALLETIERLTR